jgi:hypothetical protein
MAIDFGKFNRDPYNLEFYEEMMHLGMRGLSLKEAGEYYGLQPDDWKEWCEENPLTENRLNMGKAKGIALAGQVLLQQIKQGKTNAVTFYLKTQGCFTEKSTLNIEESLSVTQMNAPEIPIDPTEASKIYQEFMRNS